MVGRTKVRKMSNVKKTLSVGDKVQALDRGNYYDAKIVRIQSFESNVKYFIHYIGWSSTHDTWMDESKLKANSNESNTIKQKKNNKDPDQVQESEQEPEQEPNIPKKDENRTEIKSTNKRKSTDENSLDEGKKSSVKKDKKQLSLSEGQYDDSNIDEDIRISSSKLPIPLPLKRQLVSDWKLITDQSKPRLLSLPRSISVEWIISQFLDEKESQPIEDEESKIEQSQTRELFEGLVLYFDKALPLILLYRQERPQYDSIYSASLPSPPPPPSLVYGFEHLLRLFVRIPRLQGCPPSPSLTFIQSKFNEFLKFLSKNITKFSALHDYLPSLPSSLPAASSSSSSFPNDEIQQQNVIVEGKGDNEKIQ